MENQSNTKYLGNYKTRCGLIATIGDQVGLPFLPTGFWGEINTPEYGIFWTIWNSVGNNANEKFDLVEKVKEPERY